jgi:hypothetical protein
MPIDSAARTAGGKPGDGSPARIPIKLTPGQIARLDFGPSGHRDVIGHLKLPGESAKVVDLSIAT